MRTSVPFTAGVRIDADRSKQAIRVSNEAKLYLNSVGAAGLLMLVDCAVPWKFLNVAEFLSYLILACIAATCRLRLPGLPEGQSLAFAIVLIAIANLPLPETLIAGSVAVLVEALWKPRTRPVAARVLMHLGACTISIVVAHNACESPGVAAALGVELRAFAGAAVYLIANGSLIAAAVSLTESLPFLSVWRSWFISALPYYLAGAATASFVSRANPWIDWNATLTLLAPLFVIFWSYRQVVDGWSGRNDAARAIGRSSDFPDF